MDSSEAAVSNLVLELSLSAALPMGMEGRSQIRTSAAASSLASRTEVMEKKELRTYEWTLDPLMTILVQDIESPVASKASKALKTLITSRVCMNALIEKDGLTTIARVLNILLSKFANELKTHSDPRTVIENLAICYREIAMYHQWKLVKEGGIRHCVLLLKFGDVTLQTIANGILASLSGDLEICKQMFSYGAIKPIINATDAEVTNEACMLAGLGCIIQLCRIPEIGVRMVQQGAVPVIEKALLRQIGHSNKVIREKGLYALCFLSRIESVKKKLCTPKIIRGMKKEFNEGTMPARINIIETMMNIHNRYPEEREFIEGQVLDDLLNLLKNGPWQARNLAVKALLVLYEKMEDRWYMVHNGAVDAVFFLIDNKSEDLQEAVMVFFVYLCVHPTIPELLLNRGLAEICADFLYADDEIIRELAVIVLKALILFDSDEVERVVPEDKAYLLQRDIYNPQLYGGEYGGLIQEYLQRIVENRREYNYLFDCFTEQELADLGLTEEELEQYQNTFMELDADCGGSLDIDELKLLMVMMGEEMDAEELQELLDTYDEDKSGALDFKEFAIMMKGWNERFGVGLKRIWNIKTKRGAIGKARRKASKWANRHKLEAAEVEIAKEERQAEAERIQGMKLAYSSIDILQAKRDEETRLRQMGLKRSVNYPKRKKKDRFHYKTHHDHAMLAASTASSIGSAAPMSSKQSSSRFPPIGNG